MIFKKRYIITIIGFLWGLAAFAVTQEEYFEAAKKGDIQIVKAYVENIEKLKADDEDYTFEDIDSHGKAYYHKNPDEKDTAIENAYRYGHLEIVDFLLDKGAKVTLDMVNYAAITGDDNYFYRFMEYGFDAKAQEAKYSFIDDFSREEKLLDEDYKKIEALLAAQYDINLIRYENFNISSSTLETVLENKNIELAKFLLSHGADINKEVTDFSSEIPSHPWVIRISNAHWLQYHDMDSQFTLFGIAIALGNAELVQLAIDKGARLDANDWVSWALFNGQKEIAKLLIENKARHEKLSAFDYAVIMQDENKIDELLAAGYTPSAYANSPLYLAINLKDVKLVEKIIQQGYHSPNERLYVNPYSSYINLAASRGNKEILQKLVEAGGNYFYKAMDGKTALHIAALKGYADIAEYLIEQGIFIDEVDDEGFTALIYSILEEHINITKLLLEAGADTNKQTYQEKYTALHYASIVFSAPPRRYEAFELLLDYGADPFIKDSKNRDILSKINDDKAIKILFNFIKKNRQK